MSDDQDRVERLSNTSGDGDNVEESNNGDGIPVEVHVEADPKATVQEALRRAREETRQGQDIAREYEEKYYGTGETAYRRKRAEQLAAESVESLRHNWKPESNPIPGLSDDEKLLIQQEIAASKATAETAKLSALELARQAAAGVQPVAAASVDPKPQQPQQPQWEPIKTKQLGEIMGLLKKLFATGDEAQAWLKEKVGVENPADLSRTGADGVLSDLLILDTPTRTPPEPPPAEPNEVNGKVTQGQRDQIRDLTVKVYGDQAGKEQAAWLGKLGFSSAMSLDYAQAAGRILELRRIADPAGGVPEGQNPF